MSLKPFCFVLMPFGTKTDDTKKEINFDIVFESFIKKAIETAGLEPIRADEEQGGGFIHKPMYERLLFCDFAIADLSFANANVFYELGVRHTAKPYTTISIFEVGTKLPFDVAPLRMFPYQYSNGTIVDVDAQITALAAKIKYSIDAQKIDDDSPIGQMITGYIFPDLTSLESSASSFRDWINDINTSKDLLNGYVQSWKSLDKQGHAENISDEDKATIASGKAELVQKTRDIATPSHLELHSNSDLLYALLNTYKAMEAFADAEELITKVLAATTEENVYLKQQLALVMNKQKKRDQSETILLELIKTFGPNPETNGLLGSVYKGWMDDNKDNETMYSEYAQQSIEAYLAGFASDPREYYPGVNALTLLYLTNPDDKRYKKFYPLVSYAVERQVDVKVKDYWVQATALELAAQQLDQVNVKKFLGRSLFCKPDKWSRDTTAGNLSKIYTKALETNTAVQLQWLKDVITQLM